MRQSGLVCGLLGVALAASGLLESAEAAPPPPQKIVAMLDATQNFGNTQRAINFYDVTNLSGGSVFGQQPLFSVWTGWENASGSGNFEEIDSITVNPVNGTVYVVGYDSKPNPAAEGVQDGVGDTQGDYDLYRIDYQSILDYYVANNLPKGTMFAPAIGPDGAVNEPHPFASNTVFLSSGIQKIGEIGRSDDESQFFGTDVEFVNPATLILLDDEEPGADTVANDHSLRIVSRVSTAPGAATYNSTTNEGGFNGANTMQSWVSEIAAKLDMDAGTGRSEPEDMTLVTRDGVVGVWVGESDAGTNTPPVAGDDISFYEFNFATGTATKKEIKAGSAPYATGFALDDDPEVNSSSNDGAHDFVLTDGQGNLVIGESGFFDTPQTEPKIINRTILNYNGADSDGNLQNEIVPGAWDTSATLPVSGLIDDDTALTDGRFVTIDKGTGYIYYFDIDSGSPPNVVADVYVFDPATGTIVYSEKNAANHFLEEHGTRLFLRGDLTGDGKVTAADIDLMFDRIQDPTVGGTVSNAVGQEWFDLTGNFSLNGTINTPATGTAENSDIDELVQQVLHTTYGDANLDGAVSISDFSVLQNSLGKASGWATGDFNGDNKTTISDFALLQNNFGFKNFAPGPVAASIPVPEPSSLLLSLLGGVAAVIAAMASRRGRNR